MRIAKPVTNLEKSFLMYSQGLGLHKIAEFNDHNGFDGIMLGREELNWHIEFTFCLNHPVQPLQTEEDLLVLYYSDKNEWVHACKRMADASFKMMISFNPYWDMNGKTFIDSDGYRVVLQNKAWV